MAFFTNMPGAIVLLLLLILSPPLFINQAKNFALADYKLIQTLCHNSETPETCMKCVQSSKGAVKADSVGIAIVIVNCMKDKANTLALDMTNLASKSHGFLKRIYQTCATWYDHDAKKLLSSTQHALQIHKYDNAESSVVRAQNFDVLCQISLKRDEYHGKVPSDVLNDMKLYEELSEAACRVIEKIYV